MNIKHKTAGSRLKFPFVVALLSLALSGCLSMPQYQSMDDDQDSNQLIDNRVSYQIDPTISGRGLQCLAILPLNIDEDAKAPVHFNNNDKSARSNPEDDNVQADEIYDFEMNAADKRIMLRKMLYGYIAPHSTRDVELSEIDKAVASARKANDYARIGRKLNCDWLLDGEIKAFSARHFGLYSSVVVAADLKIVRASDGRIVWQGSHEATSRDGGLPLSPIDLAMGAFKASANINPETVERITGDLARRLVRTMPLESNNNFVIAARRQKIYRVIASSLNMREGPGTNFAVSKVLRNDEPVTLIQDSKIKPWILIRTNNGKSGYVSGEYLN
ncbi:MAG: SH3 domain-containing protein [Chromatiales bacterium]|jgi:hypothetical protein